LLKPPTYTVLAGIILLAILGWATQRRQGKPVHENARVTDHVTTFQSVCASCHGEKGEGKRELMTPSIASLPRWYIEEQMGKFRNGQRGAHTQDVHGQTMRAAISVLSEDQIAEALDYIDALPALSHEPTLKGDAKRGSQLYEDNCMGCHRFNGHGELVFHSASLNGLQDWYLLDQINKFQQGIRGYHPDDEAGVKMRQAVSHITSEQQKLDLLTFLTILAKKHPVVKGARF